MFVPWITLCTLLPPTSFAAHWSYRDVNHWGGTCSTGKMQSPINLDSSTAEWASWKPLQFHHYGSGLVKLINSGHSAEMVGFRKWAKRPYVTGDNIPGKYYLDHLHFHWGETDDVGSEDSVDGKRYSMEIHMPHFFDGLNKSEALRTLQGIAVIGIFLQAAPDGEALAALEEAFTEIRRPGDQSSPLWFNLRHFLPKDKTTFFRYDGSLTTPPCTEGVIWTVFTEPLRVSYAQLSLLRGIKDSNHVPLSKNWRPIQPLNGRRVYLNKPSPFL